MSLELKLRNDVWQVVGTVKTPDGDSLRVRKSTGFPKHQKQFANEVLSRTLRDAMAGRLASAGVPRNRVADAIAMFIGRPTPPGATDRGVLERFSREFGHVELTRLNQADVMFWVQSRGNKAGTVKREINSINAMLSHAKDMGMEVPMFTLKKPSVDDARTRWVSEEERDRIISMADTNVRPLIVFLFYTGARLGEAMGLTWDDVHEGRVFLRTRKGKMKTTRTRTIPLVAEVIAAMGERTGGHVFTKPDGGAWTRDRFYDYFHPACEAAGVSDFRPHDCRHTFASHLVQKGASLRAVADLLGHTSLAMVMRYSHLAPTHLESTVALLGVSGTNLTH